MSLRTDTKHAVVAIASFQSPKTPLLPDQYQQQPQPKDEHVVIDIGVVRSELQRQQEQHEQYQLEQHQHKQTGQTTIQNASTAAVPQITHFPVEDYEGTTCCQTIQWIQEVPPPPPNRQSDEDGDSIGEDDGDDDDKHVLCTRICIFYNLLVGAILLITAIILIVVINVTHGAPALMDRYPTTLPPAILPSFHRPTTPTNLPTPIATNLNN